MHTRKSTPETEFDSENLTSQKPRRRFLGQLAALFGGTFVLNTGRLTVFANERTRLTQQSSNNYPKPSYLPPGFVEVTTISGQVPNRLDGFGNNPNDVVFWYRTKFHERGPSNPLCVYVSRAPLKQFVGVEDHVPTLVEIPMGGNVTVSGEYHDGMWMPSPTGEKILPKGARLKWDTSNVHSLIFKFGAYTFAVRGSRVVGIDLKDLIRIAGSIE